MKENGSSYSFAEIREIVALSRDPQATISMSEALMTANSLIEEQPDFTWSEFCQVFPKIETLERKGAALLHSVYERYAASREATLFWKQKYDTNPEATLDEIKAVLPLPENIVIDGIGFATDCCVLLMDKTNVSAAYQYLWQQQGFKGMENSVARGFASGHLFLSDLSDHSCGVVVADPHFDEVVNHEVQHNRFAQYYARDDYLPVVSATESVKEQMKKKSLSVLNKKESLPGLQRETRKVLDSLLFDSRMLLVDEILAVAAGEENNAYIDFIIESDNFKPYHFGSVATFHSYGADLKQKMQGIIAAVLEQKISEEDKIKLWWNVELTVGQFLLENEAIAITANNIWEDVGRDKKQFISQIESLPLHAMNQLSLFTKNQRDFEHIVGYRQKEVMNSAYWSMIMNRMELEKDTVVQEIASLGLGGAYRRNEFSIRMQRVVTEQIIRMGKSGITIPDNSRSKIFSFGLIYAEHLLTKEKIV